MTIKAAGLVSWAKKKIDVAGTGLENAARAARASINHPETGLVNAPIHSKIGLGLGVTSMGISISNYKANQDRLDSAAKQQAIEQKSLNALEKIHQAIAKTDSGTVK